MQPKSIAIFAAVTAAILAGALLLQRDDVVTDASTVSGALLPNLAQSRDKITGLRIRDAGDTLRIDLAQKEGTWVLANKADYPADLNAIRNYVTKVAESQLREAKTANPDKYAVLGVSDVSNKDATGIAVEFVGAAEPNQFIAGTLATTGGSGTYVRRAGDKQSYLASEVLRPEVGIANWVQAEIINLAGSRIREVVITDPEGKALRAFKENSGDANFQVADVPKGRSLSSEFAANALSSTTDSLRLEDVEKAADRAVAGDAWKARYHSFEGIVVEATHWRADDKEWLQLQASLDEDALGKWIDLESAKEQAKRAADAAKTSETSADPAADSDKTSAPEAAAPSPFDQAAFAQEKRNNIEDEIRKINARTAGWSYAIPTWKAENIRKRINDLLAEKGATK